MTRFMLLVTGVLTCAMVAVPSSADDPPKKLTAEERQELETKWNELNAAGSKSYQAGNFAAALKASETALEIARRLYPKAEFPDGHANLARSMNDLAYLYDRHGRLADAEPLYKNALEMRKKLFAGDNSHVAGSLNNLAALYKAQGKLAQAEPLYKDALEMFQRLYKGDHPAVALTLNNMASIYQDQGKLTDAEPLYKDALEMSKRIHDGDHPAVALSLNNLAVFYQNQGKLAEAELRFKDALEMRKRLFKGDHPDLGVSLNNLAGSYKTQGKLAEAEPLYKEAIAMHKRAFKGDHLYVALSLNNLASLYLEHGKLADAEVLFKDALEMRKRLFKGDHSALAVSLSNLANLYVEQRKLTEAEAPCKDALEMRKRLFKGDHPAVAVSLNDLAYLYYSQGKLAEAEPLYKDALAMYNRVFKGDHPNTAGALSNLALLSRALGKLPDAEMHARTALAMSRRLTQTYALRKSEGEALTHASYLPIFRDGFLSITLQQKSDPAITFSELWADKGFLARISEQRQVQARASTPDPLTAKLLTELAVTRRRRAELLLAPATNDATTRKQRGDDLKAFEEKLAELESKVRPLLPAIARTRKLDAATPSDLQKALPADAAVVDFIRFSYFEFDEKNPGKFGAKQTPRYLAFVVTRDKVVWADLDTATNIEPAVTAWREAITGGKDIPAALPAKVRELVWEKVRKELPASIKAVYVCPDAVLCRVPWAALPGDKAGSILLEDYAVATIPHSPFLLDKLWPQDPLKNPPSGALIVGGVKYDADLAPPAPATVPALPLVKPGAKGWSFLPGTAAEATGVFGAATTKKLPVTNLQEQAATTSAVLAALPKARYAHFATHGFFADPSFRSIFQLDEKDYEQSRRGERIGRAANSPLVMTGLVFAGANNPKTHGRGIVTGESLIDLDLSGLELAVLSACETGLGDVAGGEGTFGLQRAFHLAGTRDVVASLWKVPDQSTAALMALFYQNLWDKNLSPMEALRQAQLTIYRDPSKIPELAKGFRGKFEEVPGMVAEVETKPAKDGKAHPLLWAAFTLSGPGR